MYLFSNYMKFILIYICAIFIGNSSVQTDNYATAQKFNEEKNYKESIAICTSELKKLSPKNTLFTKFLSLRADSYRESGNFTAGIQDFTALIEINPKNISYYVGLSYMYGSIKLYRNCLSALEKALIIEPKNIYTFNNLSYYSSQAGNYNEAIKYANEGLKYVIDPMWKGALLNNRGYGYIGLKAYKEALSDINETIKLDPNNSFAYCYRAIANINLKNFETVCADLNKAKSLGGVELTEDLRKQYCKD